jgi:hypothetical protein
LNWLQRKKTHVHPASLLNRWLKFSAQCFHAASVQGGKTMAKAEAANPTENPSAPAATEGSGLFKSKKKLVIIVVAALLVLGGGGAGAWWFLKPAHIKEG